MERIEQSQFFAEPERALERARANGETLEITSDGKTVARLVPEVEAPRSSPPYAAGAMKGKMWFIDPNDTLDDLLTPEEVAQCCNFDPTAD